MADFKQAIEWLKEGKKVRRKDWFKNSYYFLDKGGVVCLMTLDGIRNIHFILEEFDAKDWELYKK